ncbi:MAG TPA: dihydrolipoyl dehydrogenase [Candidatus Polarisedimenticolaceae bacterium]|nr:dihydrolipoyl dehydrogenase [Candidatus Polarisedimenticolaceae bacterium]
MADGAQAELVVVGAGPGGYAAAFLAADLGLDVTLIDPEPNPGGVCLYRGCIPSKALLHVAKLIGEARQAASWGVTFGEPRIDLERLRGFKQGVVERLTRGLGELARKRKVEHLRGRARFTAPDRLTVEANDGRRSALGFRHAIIATGSRPVQPAGFPENTELLLDSTGALDLPDVPRRLLVVGGGYIGLELGSVYAALGSEVSLVEMTDGLLPGVDRDLVRPLANRLGRELSSIRLATKVVEMTPDGDGLRVRLESGDGESVEQRFDRALVSVGRRPNSEQLGLEQTAVVVGESGFIQVDEQLRTAEPTIFAIGDVVGQPMLAHKASHEGRTAVEAIAGHKVAFEPAAIPAVVFTDPEVAWCGLTEDQAKAEGRKVSIARFPWGASGRALTLDRDDGLSKLVIDGESERILGVGLVGAGAGELIAEGVLAVEMGAVAADVKLTIHPHPTLSETMMEAAEVFYGQSTHVYRPKR